MDTIEWTLLVIGGACALVFAWLLGAVWGVRKAWRVRALRYEHDETNYRDNIRDFHRVH